MTELFGPVLGVMKFKRLEEAIELVNRTGYGLTSGLQSLDDREQEIWQQRIRAGNLYINRPTTGAVVLRQPFGGMGKSAWGPGIKAGGPNYVVPLMQFEELPAADLADRCGMNAPDAAPEATATANRHNLLQQLSARLTEPAIADMLRPLCQRDWDEVLARVRFAAIDFAHWASEEYLAEHDTLRLVGQDNRRRYRPVEHLRLRVLADDPVDDVLLAVMAAVAVGCRPVLSICPGVSKELVKVIEALTADWAARIEWVEEDEATLANEIRRGFVDRIRLPGGDLPGTEVLAACREAFVPLLRTRALALGRVEPLWYVQEQSVSVDYHRYGNLGRRVGEKRRPVK
jgi:RHH-type proline utilization regulon transcriptional repressor/proline dehydrogenase/delta 1-pyrroline-5-carboxylate dehydrogenase